MAGSGLIRVEGNDQTPQLSDCGPVTVTNQYLPLALVGGFRAAFGRVLRGLPVVVSATVGFDGQTSSCMYKCANSGWCLVVDFLIPLLTEPEQDRSVS